MKKQRFTEEEKALLDHALDHLKSNKIHVPDWKYGGGWYRGDRQKFIDRHVKAIAFLRELLGVNP